MAKAKPYFQVSTRKPVVVPVEKLYLDDLFFIDGERLYMLSPYRPGGVFILQEVVDPETLIRLGFMEEPVVEEPQEPEPQEPEDEGRLPEGFWEPEEGSPVEPPPPNPEEPTEEPEDEAV